MINMHKRKRHRKWHGENIQKIINIDIAINKHFVPTNSFPLLPGCIQFKGSWIIINFQKDYSWNALININHTKANHKIPTSLFNICMALILDGRSEHVAHIGNKITQNDTFVVIKCLQQSIYSVCAHRVLSFRLTYVQ